MGRLCDGALDGATLSGAALLLTRDLGLLGGDGGGDGEEGVHCELEG